MAGPKYSAQQKELFFELIDKGGTVRAAAKAVGVHEDAAYRWLRLAGLSMQRALTHHAMVGSMGQVGSAADNAAMESFFSLLQRNVLDRRRWATRDELRIAIVTWIERTHHRRRRQASLGREGRDRVRTHHEPDRHPGGLTNCHQFVQQPHEATWQDG
jgi:transposase InsO family protein